MGGAAASALGMHNPGLKVTVDQTFASIHEVSANVGRALFEQLVPPRTPRQLRPLVRRPVHARPVMSDWCQTDVRHAP